MLKKILLGLILLIAALLIYAATQPSQMLIAREQLIKATPDVIFPYINHSKKSNEWMPWKDSDPKVEMIYSGPEEGLGSTSSWDSPGQMGTGQAVVVESIPLQHVKTQLTYTKPMQMSQLATISLTPTSDGTLVRWEVTGENSFLGRLMCLFFDMDELVGSEFEKGLMKLKKTIEG